MGRGEGRRAKVTCPEPYGYEVSVQKLQFAISVPLLLGSKCPMKCAPAESGYFTTAMEAYVEQTLLLLC